MPEELLTSLPNDTVTNVCVIKKQQKKLKTKQE